MTILLAPDKFKGSLTAQEVCAIAGDAIAAIDPSHRITAIPLADGGEGSCELLTSFSGGSFTTVRVHDPLFRPIKAHYGITKDGTTAFLEMAVASGLQLLKPPERNPSLTSTIGTGELMRHALDHSVQQIVLGIGGSATNDAGMGMATALGIQFFSDTGELLEPIGKNLSFVHRIDTSLLHPRLAEVNITIFCDVDNPLHGAQGAAYTFAPQKGADRAMVILLDTGLQHYEAILERTFHKPVNFPGAGAGGGLPASLQAITNLNVRAGIDFIMEFTRLEEHIREADLIITGEGKIDEQTLHGKVVNGVAKLARKHHKPLVAIAGKSELTPQQTEELGIRKIITIANASTPEEQAMQNAGSLLKKRILNDLKPFLIS
ncbi:MAG TPA: glycerate kinase [Ohtaekwangia sp.]|uniref:glycerate kinase n=1 Tax=Ohtaekwangia sp. TaxID=2066019 RepID=UPI002F951200